MKRKFKNKSKVFRQKRKDKKLNKYRMARGGIRL